MAITKTVGFRGDFMTPIARQAALKLCLPPPVDTPAFKIGYWDRSGDLGVAARYLTTAVGKKRKRTEDDPVGEPQSTSSPKDANEKDVVDVTTLNAPPALPSCKPDPSISLRNYDKELALESWMGEIKGRIEARPAKRAKTEDDVYSEHFGPAKVSRGLKWFYDNRFTRMDAGSTPRAHRTPCHKSLLKSGLNAVPIPRRFASEINAKVRLDGPRTRAKHHYVDIGYKRRPRICRRKSLEKLRDHTGRKPSRLGLEITLPPH